MDSKGVMSQFCSAGPETPRGSTALRNLPWVSIRAAAALWTRFELDLAHRWLLGLVQFLDVWTLLDGGREPPPAHRTQDQVQHYSRDLVCQVRDRS